MANPSIEERRAIRKKWKNRLIDWRTSGLSQAEYCRRNSIDNRQLSKWKLKLDDPDSVFTKTHDEGNSFIEIPIANVRSNNLHIGIDIKDSGEIIISVKKV